MTTFQPVITEDGSLTCLDLETGELCHNKAGASTEALKIYTQPSELLQKLSKTGHIRLLDACYGLGYNTWVLARELLQALPHMISQSQKKTFTVEVVAVECSSDIIAFLPTILDHLTLDDLKNKISHFEHNTYYRTLDFFFDQNANLLQESDKDSSKAIPKTENQNPIPNYYISSINKPENDLSPISLHFKFELWVEDLRKKIPSLTQDFNAVFHDAFSPQKMPELWTADLFREYYRLLQNRRGRLLTYSSAGAVRGGLKEAGFHVGKTMGLGSKSSGTIAFSEKEELSFPGIVNPCFLPSVNPIRTPLATAGDFPPLGGGEFKSSNNYWNDSILALESNSLSQSESESGFELEDWELNYMDSRAGLPYRDAGLQQSREDIIKARQQEQSISTRPRAEKRPFPLVLKEPKEP